MTPVGPNQAPPLLVKAGRFVQGDRRLKEP
jgi:hypothetical protein